MIADDEDEELIMVQILKKKGFKVMDWGHGNHPLGPRIITLKLENENCECEVQKIYYSSNSAPTEIYKTTESIKCKIMRQ